MSESLETKLHNFLKSNIGKRFSYNEIKYMVENVWKTQKGGFSRMETLTRRWRKDNSKLNDISSRIGRVYKNGAIVELYYIADSEMSTKSFCCTENWNGLAHNVKCSRLRDELGLKKLIVNKLF